MKRLSASFRHEDEGKEDGSEADGRVQPERAAVAHLVAEVGKRFDRQKQFKIRQTGRQARHDRSHFGWEKLSDVEEGNRTQADGVCDHEEGDAKQRKPVEAFELFSHRSSGLSRVHDDGQDDERDAHDEGGNAEQESARIVLNCRNENDGSDQLDHPQDDGREVLVDAARRHPEDVDSVETQGHVAGKEHLGKINCLKLDNELEFDWENEFLMSITYNHIV